MFFEGMNDMPSMENTLALSWIILFSFKEDTLMFTMFMVLSI